ncbi:hypothetical protein K402DRAFT_399889 [Aulographum hederae CBS 113979]|uniref:WW-domain-binding protein n=1 Tax=Aulographum hederae CBS 113979 TaxID=1176131 RepID=A0A6G1HFZ3_9PEZI|nr:hypothetical protein K402DRAFT_399889 [Aulographum hederae CBS 113979]
MSVNWVMLSKTEGFTPLPGEQRLYTSPPRTTLHLQSVNKFPGHEPYSITSSGGCVHLTNRRIVYLPSSPTPQLTSFSAPILNLQDTHVTAPFFGPNVFTAILKPVPGGGIPAQHVALELKMTFKEGGAYDFSTTYERIKERLQQAVEVARDNGYNVRGDGSEQGGGQGGVLPGVNMGNVHLDELPAYEAEGRSVPLPQPIDVRGASGAGHGIPSMPVERDSDLGPEMPQSQRSPDVRSPVQQTFSPPAEPPPGYEEVQSQSVADELERRMRRSQ